MKKTLSSLLAMLFILSLLPMNISAGDETYFYEKADDDIIESYSAGIDARIDAILNSPTTVEVTGTKYYVSSSSGNDKNDGLSPQTAWKTIDKVNAFKYNAGDGVFFKRGDSWRTVIALQAKSGVTYSAYGSGAKPKLICSVDASGSERWLETEYPNIYVYADYIDWNTRNIGTIVFDGGRAWGIHVSAYNDGRRVDNGNVFNGLEYYDTDNGMFTGYQDLSGNLEFYHDKKDGAVYLYCKEGNPGDVFSSIELTDDTVGIDLQKDATGYQHDIVIDNLAVFGTSSSAISSSNVKNVTIQYCTVEWIGGCIIWDWPSRGYDYPIRYGNGITNYASCENLVMRYNYASQVYNCSFSQRCESPATYINLQMYGNVSEYSGTGIELYTGNGGTMTGVQVYDNHFRYLGYGFTHQRPGEGVGGSTYTGLTNTSINFDGNDFYNNVSLLPGGSTHSIRALGPHQYNLHDNTYIANENITMGSSLPTNVREGTGLGKFLYNESSVAVLSSTGLDPGGKFYYVNLTEAEEEALYKLYSPDNGVKVFKDISETFWGRDAIDYVALNGLMSGMKADEFSPNSKMTRAMLVTVLSRLDKNTSKDTTTSFADVKPTDWYAAGVAWAERNGIVAKGASFRPNANATREEMADMLYRYAICKFKQGSLDGAKAFADEASITASYKDGIKFCTKNGIVGGYSDNTIKPRNEATRAEVATMIMRFVKYLRNAKIDTQAAVNNAKKVVLSGESLKSVLDNSLVRATVEADGTVKFVPFKDSGLPSISILNALNTSFKFTDYPYVAIKFNANLTDPNMVVRVYVANDTGRTLKVKPTDTSMVLNLSEYVSSISSVDYLNNMTIKMMPWGSSSRTLNLNDYFIIDEIAFFDNITAAQEYVK